jgi:starch synthase
LGWELFSPKTLEFYGKINLMKGGLVFADLLSTVSSKYREEIMTPEFGFGLEGLFQERASELHGILEGVDYETWDPSRCPHIAATYGREQLEGKAACKAALVGRFNLTLPPGSPLIGMTTRFFERKGIDLVENILDDLMKLEVGFIIQGTGEERHQYLLQEISSRYPEKMALSVGYSHELAHQIIAGADIFIMPSRYEPCGLDQLYCLRYGAIPVVRATGGLDETIREYNPETGEGNGFKFSGYTPTEFLGAIRLALALFQDRAAWQALMRRNMALDYSWETVAPKYVSLYQEAVDKRRRLLGG